MSELQPTLELFGFTSVDELTVDSLKKSFKTHIVKAHPDKGGNPEVFDKMLAGYIYLTEIIQRISGGRSTLQTIVTPDELKEMRVDEIINRIFEEFDNDNFNERFEKENIKEIHGYDTWLKEKNEDDNLTEGEFGDATQKVPTFDEKDFHKIFLKKVKEGKPEPTAIILHPEQMAYISGYIIGTDLIESNEGGYTSHTFNNPKYTDAYEAFSNLTISDKVPEYSETNKSVDDLIAERNQTITPFNNTELKAIQDYEKMKLEKNINNLSKVKEYFEYDGKIQTSLENWPPENYSNDEYKGFIVDL
jgi:hypothetical protein